MSSIIAKEESAATTVTMPILKNVPKGTKINKFAYFAYAFSDPNNEVSAVTEENLKTFGVVETKEAIVKTAESIYSAASTLASIRESMGVKEDEKLLVAPSRELRQLMRAWFAMCGTRPPVMKPNKKYNEDEGRRPLYSVTDADLVLLGEVCADARNAVDNDLSKVGPEFLNRLVIMTGRLLAGKPLARISADDLKEARKEANRAKAERAKKTREKNTKKASEAESVRAERDQLKAELEKIKASVIEMGPVIDAILNSHATYEEKEHILKLLGYNGEKKPAAPAEKAADVKPEEKKPAAKAEPKAEEKPAAKAEPKIKPVRHKQAA